jgi:hypothetical protein
MTDISPVYSNIQLKPLHLSERTQVAPAAVTTDKSTITGNPDNAVNKVQNKSGLSIPSKLLNWGKGFGKGVYSYTLGLILNPIKSVMIMGAGLVGALLLKQAGFSANKAVKTELILVGAASAVKGVFDVRGYIKNKNAGKIENAKKNIENLGKNSAYMCLPLAIPFVPAATKFASTKGLDFIKYAIKKLF